jgi:hypothetical protein
MSDPLNRKPWPMKWVFLAIVACIVPYTILTIKYRKPSPAYQPYEDSKQRANVMRLLDAGYQRITVTAERPADPQNIVRHNFSAVTANAPGGLPDGLATTLVEVPPMPVSFSSVLAPSDTASMLPYPLLFTCVLEDQKHQLAGAQLFVRGKSVVIIPIFEPLDGDLTARSKESPVLINIPGGTFQTGENTVTLVGSKSSQQWTLNVR